MTGKKAIRDAWRDPSWAFHTETTYWYRLADIGYCMCRQDTRIELGDDGLGYDVAIPGRYTVKVEPFDYGDESPWLMRTFEGVGSHAELKRLAVDWMHEALTAA